MKFLENIDIRSRLMMICVVWMTAFAGFCIFAIVNIQHLGNVAKNIYEYPLQVSNAAIEARVDIIKINRDMKDIILMVDIQEISLEMNKITFIEDRVIKNLDIIKKYAVAEDTRMLQNKARELLSKWKKNREEMVKLIYDDRWEDAARISKENNTYFVQQLEDVLVEIDNIARNRADRLIEKAARIVQSQKIALILSMIILAAVSFVFFLLIIRSILVSITSLKNAMHASSNTGELVESVVQGKNEIVDMAKHYNSLIRKLTDLFWIKDAQNMLNHELSGNMSISELAQRSVSFLARSTQAGNGVFYLYDSGSELLYLSGSFAFSNINILKDRFTLGEGIVGQVALDRRPVLLNNINNGDALITSGTVNQAPLNLYAFPLIFEGELYGVIELSSFEPFSQLKQEFLNEASRIIAINLYSILQNQKVVDLLKVAKQAKEDVEKTNIILKEQQSLLQQRTEELQISNAELEEHQQMLMQQSEEIQQTNLQLEEQQQQMEEQSRLLSVQNRDLEESQQELIKRTVELEAVSKYKSEFLANMSHELRTPLNSIILLSGLMTKNEKKDLPQNALEKIDVILKSGKELLRLVNDILDLTKIESGRMGLNIAEFHSGELINELRQLFETSAMEKNIEFYSEDLVGKPLIGDKDKISQILRNFLSNAIKFTETGSVTVKAEEDGSSKGTVLFTITDTGIGISEEQMALIFNEFQQGDGSISRKYGGTGLGLTISKKLAELMNGQIELSSQPGVGSVFSLRIHNIMLNANKDKMPKNHTFPADEDAQKVHAAVCDHSSDKTILVISTDEQLIGNIRRLNTGMGFKTLTASSGGDGLEMAVRCRVSGILLDIMLPDKSGLEVLKELKSSGYLRGTPIHIISARNKKKRMECLEQPNISGERLYGNEIACLVADMVACTNEPRKKLLIIQGEAVQREVIEEVIEKVYADVCVVDSDEKARYELNKRSYDAVILDLKFNNGDGSGICRFIDENKIMLPVIIYTESELTFEQEKEMKKYSDSIIIKKGSCSERLLDEVTLFLYKVKKSEGKEIYLSSRTNRENCFNLKDKKILVVDDDPRNLFVIASALENYGAQILDAENGKAAIEILNTQMADLVLMDIMMPVMDGYEAIKTIKSDYRLKHIPVIALTAKSLKGDKEKCITAGADDYISKPVDYDVLIRLVNAWIHK